ncbi:MAG: hypothetical protein US94_C0018G0008 [Berkelbacteria bacterium GW2011_GWB1_38_5]|uniref:Uncharacterized protein n=1 Tax=Berkelbacteria bacterium GW2011_GWB1_38_5 TaxID=1618336 RepID=A0A0G0KEN0_9BACT|nr:MAG: hypothetical protein US94_C0018G0008 [Berkelbacteria bacterium GW2011_GWB1_38_5]
MDKKERFYKVYGNLPLGLRGEVVAVVEGEPISWKVAKLEIDENTKKGEEVLDQLIRLEII